jgi:hypothetical protein
MMVSNEVYNTNPQSQVSSYVEKLEDYVYGYSFMYPFADGQDVAVISMRDDLMTLEEPCYTVTFVPIESKNLLEYSEEFEPWQGYDSIEMDVDYGPLGGSERTADEVAIVCTGGGVCKSASSRPASVPQGVPSGKFVGSVYIQIGRSPTNRDKMEIGELSIVAEYRLASDPTTVVEAVLTDKPTQVYPDPSWVRYDVSVDGLRPPIASPPENAEIMTLRLVVTPLDAVPAGTSVSVLMWGAQIEPGASPTQYERTGALSKPLYELDPTKCQTDWTVDPWTGDPIEVTYYTPSLKSSRLRSSFSVKCVQDDFAITGQSPTTCANRGGVEYLERPFVISLDSVESGALLQHGQIGGGNYNYRIDSLAVNLVGSNVKDCSLDPGAGTSCYTSLFIPYDLIQDGKVKLRSHSGAALPFNLTVGRIHQGKALAAERLLTNPLSSTDNGLVQQYLKGEFRGRPIQGSYTLRIFNVPSLRWSNVEDIQILLNFRYWSAYSNP